MNKEKLQKIVQALVTLKEKVNCPICLELIQDAVELKCGHRYCSSCFTQYKSRNKNSFCPLCKKPINKRFINYKDLYANELSNFVSHAYSLIKEKYGYEVDWLNKNQEKLGKIFDEAGTTETIEIDRLKPANLKISKPLCEEAFDKLVSRAKNTYGNKKKQKDNEVKYQLHHFCDEDNRLRVIKWLNSNKYTLDKLTQSEELKESIEDNDFNLLSVSQISQIFVRKKKTRSQSMDIERKHIFKPVLRKSTSFGKNLNNIDNYVIEGFDSEKIIEEAEKKVILDLLEDECLENLESMAHVTMVKDNESKKSKRKHKTSVTCSSVSGGTGWDRMRDVKKTIRKSAKTPKKLNITLQPRKEKQENSAPKIKDIILKNREKIVEAENNIVEKTSEKDHAIFSLSVVEDYFSKKMANKDIVNVDDESRAEVKPRQLNVMKVETISVVQNNNKFDNKFAPVFNPQEVHTHCNTNLNVLEHLNNKLIDENVCDDIFLLPTQKTNEDENTSNHLEVPILPAVDENCEDLDTIIILLENNLENCKNNVSKSVAELFHNLQTYIEKIKSIRQQKLPIYSKQVQTVTTSCISVAVQTINVDKSEKSIETVKRLDKRENNLRIQSNEGINKEEKVIDVIDVGCSRNHLGTAKSSFEENLNTTKSKKSQKIPESLLYCSMEPTVPNIDKKINRQLVFNEPQSQRRFKRIRLPISDSDSENENLSKKRPCNRFIIDDLTVQFTETQNVIAQDKDKNSLKVTSDSENMDYDKYLEEVMKRYDTPQNSPEKEESSLRVEEDNELQKMCDNLIDKVRKRDYKRKSIDENSAVDKLPKLSKNPSSENQINGAFEPLITNCSSQHKLNRKSTQKKDITSQETDNDFQEMCDQLMEQIRDRDHVDNNFKIKNSQDNWKLSSNSLLNKENLDILENDITEYEKKLQPQSLENSDIIENTENINQSCKTPRKDSFRKKKFSESLFPNNDHLSMTSKQVTKDDCVLGTFDDGLDAELEMISFTAEQKKNENEVEKLKINVLQNIKIKSQDRNDVDEISISNAEDILSDVDDTVEKIKINIMQNIEIKSQDKKTVDEISISDEENILSDGDVVETTPQKNDRPAINLIGNTSKIAAPGNSFYGTPPFEDLALDIYLPPPPGFEDLTSKPEKVHDSCLSDENEYDLPTAKVSLNSSLTPDKLSQLIANPVYSHASHNKTIGRDCSNKENYLEKHDKLLATPKKDTFPKENTNLLPNTQNFIRGIISLSPINREKANLLQIAQSSKYTPLVTTTKLSTKKQNIMTSTPNQKSILNYIKMPEGESLPQQQKPCVACTRVVSRDHLILSHLENRSLITFSSTFGPHVTHMLVSVNDNNCVKAHTAKYVLAVAAGIWVLKMEWVQKCLSKNHIVPEEPYEVLDVSGAPGPKTSRLTRKSNPLLKGYKFYCAPPFSTVSQGDVEDIIKMLGGEIVLHPKEFLRKRGYVNFIITDPNATEDADKFENWLEQYKVVTVDVEWLTRSVGQYKLLSARPYMLCSDDSICDLSYPPHLVETVPYTYSD